MRLYAGGDDGSVQEHLCALSKYLEPGQWLPGFIFPNSNGLAGVSASQDASQNNTVETIWLSNTKNELELWWKDFRWNTTNITTPVGVWTNG